MSKLQANHDVVQRGEAAGRRHWHRVTAASARRNAGVSSPDIVALIVLDPEAAAAFAGQHGVTDPVPAILAGHPAVRAAVAAAAETANSRLSRVEQVKRFAILPTFWEPGGDEITPTMKLTRGPVAAKYADVIDSLYAAAGEPGHTGSPPGHPASITSTWRSGSGH